MKNLYLVLVASLCLFSSVGCGSVATAQPSPPTVEATSTSGSEVEDATQDEEELAPLESVELPAPVLSTGENGERQTYLSEGEPAPWPGVLLNPEAIAFIISQYEAAFERANAALELQRDSDMNRLQLEVGRLRLRLDTERAEHEVIVGGLEREVERLIQIHEEFVEQTTGGFWNSDVGQVIRTGLIIIGGAAVGVVVGMVAGALSF